MSEIKLIINNCVKTINIVTGTKLSTILETMSLKFDFSCGGLGKCGKCKVKIQGSLSQLSKTELDLLTPFEIENKIRLACQVKIVGDSVCFIHTKKATVFTVINNKPLSLTFKQNLLKNKNIYGAIDIGSTTICIKLCSPDGTTIAQSSAINPTCNFGTDVITRIDKAVSGKLNTMCNMLIKKLNQMLYDLIPSEQLLNNLVITGNTTMLSLLTKTDCSGLSTYPFKPSDLFGVTISNKTLGLLPHQNFNIYLPRCISAFIGADVFTGLIYVSGLNRKSSNYLIVDIGTNGEILLSTNKNILCCSTAMGPAFEGANIKMGMRAENGAINKVYLKDNKLKFTTINNAKPVGICGSGLIDLISVLLQINAIDETGLLIQNDNIIKINGQKAFKLPECNIFLTQEDIRNVQLSKAALCAGIKTILLNRSLPYNNLRKVFIAGNFGNFINIKNAVHIGLLPPELENKCEFISNAALKGALKFAVANKSLQKEYIQNIKNFRVLNLSTSSCFNDLFVDCLHFSKPIN